MTISEVEFSIKWWYLEREKNKVCRQTLFNFSFFTELHKWCVYHSKWLGSFSRLLEEIHICLGISKRKVIDLVLVYLIQNCETKTNKRISPTVQLLLDRLQCQMIDLGELFSTLEEFGFLAFSCPVIGVLLEFRSMSIHLLIHRMIDSHSKSCSSIVLIRTSQSFSQTECVLADVSVC